VDKNKYILAFGALLHDVGKVVRRSQSAGNRPKHSIYGEEFMCNMIAPSHFCRGYNGDDGLKIIEQIRYHHEGEMDSAAVTDTDSLAWITCFSDNISANMDRKSGDVERHGSRSWFLEDAPLRKVYNIIDGHKDDNTFDTIDYNSICEAISKELVDIEVSWRGVSLLLNLLEKTTDQVPSSTMRSELIDVSLFDHSKTTAAIAACVYEYVKANGISNYKHELKDRSKYYYEQPMFLLFSCDISGIQNFIYNISGEGALKQLRARSFYLEMILEHIADEVLECLELSRANLLYTGGGHAYMLLPNTDRTKEKLDRSLQELEDWFLHNYRTDLYMASATVECSADDIKNRGDNPQRYRSLFVDLAQKLSDAKATRYSAQIIRKLNYGDATHFDHSRECVECLRTDTLIDEKTGLCSLCSALHDISRILILPESDIYVVLDENTVSDRPYLPLPFGRKLQIYQELEYSAKEIDAVRVYLKNRWGDTKDLATHIWLNDYTADQKGKGISFYAPVGVTLDVNDKDEKLGINRLGVLRADIDNLSKVFVRGLPDDKVSISRTSTLSRSLSYFFKAQIKEVLEKGRYQAQIIYSGGDDLFLVGNWSDVLYAAIDIRKALDEYTGNGVLTISAGIGMYEEKFPIARMAYEVGELESTAKLFSEDGAVPTKNAVALWSTDTVYSWLELIDFVEPRMREIKVILHGDEKALTFAHQLLALLRDTENPASVPRLAYLLARHFDSKDGKGDDRGHIAKRLFEWATDDKERRYLATALEWYVYSVREKGEQDE